MKYRSKRRKKSALPIFIGGFGFLFILSSVMMLLSDLRGYRQQTSVYPAGLSVAGIPVGGLTQIEAEARLRDHFALPVELRYNDARMQFLPAELGFSLNLPATLGPLASVSAGGWWDHLWGRVTTVTRDFPLQATVDLNQTREFLQATIAPRYDQPPTAALPVLYSTHFDPGQPGFTFDLEAALPVVRDALLSPTGRVVSLTVRQSPALPLDRSNLEVFLKQTVLLEGFDGLVEVYLRSLATDETLHFAIRGYQPVAPDVAYSAASTIKIPIMASTFNHLSEPVPEQALTWMERMIDYSENPPAEALMSTYLDAETGPLVVTQDLRDLGYQNTFLAGFFYSGAPLLQRFSTPANNRTDIYLDPDLYNQTVPSEIGDLLTRVYHCARGTLTQDMSAGMFSGSVSQIECRTMLDLLSKNKIGALIEAGLPPEGSAAHKHGWTSDLDGLLHTMSDAGVVSTPGGDYVLIIFINSTEQLVFSEGNWLFARLSQSIYNSYNIERQAAWLAN